MYMFSHHSSRRKNSMLYLQQRFLLLTNIYLFKNKMETQKRFYDKSSPS